MDEHDPQSTLECELVERLAGILWRLRRVPFFEAGILDACHQRVTNQKNYGRPLKPEGPEEKEELDEEESEWENSVHFGGNGLGAHTRLGYSRASVTQVKSNVVDRYAGFRWAKLCGGVKPQVETLLQKSKL
jgi:hypothetical protein